MLEYDTSNRRCTSIRRGSINSVTLAYMGQVAVYREELARRVCDLCDCDISAADLPDLLRRIDAAPSLRQLVVIDCVIVACEQLADDRCRVDALLAVVND